MPENTFEIILQGVDNATGEINRVKGALNEVEKTTKTVQKTSEDAGKSIKQQFKEAGTELKDFRRAMLLVTVAMATVIATTREAAKFSKEAKTTYDDFTVTMQTLSVTVGQMLAPALEGVSFIVKVLTDTIEAAVAGFIKLSTMIAVFFENVRSGPVEAYRRAMEAANIATDNFLNKIEATRSRVAQGLTFEKEKQNVIEWQKITVTAAKMMKQHWDNVTSALGNLGSALSGAEELGKGFAKAAAVVAIGMAIINTAQGITAALAGPPTGPPWPLNLIMASLVAATGAIQIATISAQSFAEGGRPPLGKASIVGERGPELFMPDTAGTIIPNNRLGGYFNQQSFNIEINNPVVRSDEDIDKLTEEISLRLAREAERL